MRYFGSLDANKAICNHSVSIFYHLDDQYAQNPTLKLFRIRSTAIGQKITKRKQADDFYTKRPIRQRNVDFHNSLFKN